MTARYDFAIIGGGIVGLATAAELLRRRPDSRLVLLEKESALATHQTGHNSGVIHSGIYYEPGSLKATLCARGAELTKEFAAAHDIAVNVCGKLLVVTTPRELAGLDQLRDRARDNGIAAEYLDAVELSRREPAIQGLGALLISSTAIVDYTLIAQRLAGEVRRLGGEIELGVAVSQFAETTDAVTLADQNRQWQAEQVIACAGLQADRIARLAGLPTRFQIVPFRGEYFRLPPARNDLITHLIYPVPDPTLPFLGIHLTRTPDGAVTVGPNAVLGLAREGYAKGSFNWRDVSEYARFPGLWRVARRHARVGARELRNSLLRRYYLAECRKYCPELTVDDLLPEPAGIRAQAVLRDGTLVHDFLFARTDRSLHVCNAPSPAATSALPIAEHIADQVSA